LDGRFVDGRNGKEVGKITFLAWSKSRCKREGLLPSRTEGKHEDGELWFCLPLKGQDIAVCVVASFKSKAAEGSYRHLLRRAKIV
jgi:hypothetical protein